MNSSACAGGDAEFGGSGGAHRRLARRATKRKWKCRRGKSWRSARVNVLIKGGHGGGDESVDLLIGQGDVVRLSAKRIATKNTHGTGCTLSSAIAAGLAKGLDLAAAAHDAKAYVTSVIAAADQLEVGHGHGPLHHYYAQWRDE